MISHDQVLRVLKDAKGPLKNIEIRRVIFGVGNEESDRAGANTSVALQRLKMQAKVQLLPGGRWALEDVIDCPACEGRGHLTKKRAVALKLVKK